MPVLRSLIFFLDFTVFPGRAEMLNHLKGFGYLILATKVQIKIKTSE